LTSGLARKQDTLTAGDNITIENNVISATGGSGSSYENWEDDCFSYTDLTVADFADWLTELNNGHVYMYLKKGTRLWKLNSYSNNQYYNYHFNQGDGRVEEIQIQVANGAISNISNI
jgi:hypothetical protein